ncbi:50S ribosomal protein L32 [Candidatus Gottesmanbacteria bacterium]|nr:50S ribosomal protein L32 [Candidatus Gottesmanbacteria bacterium]
MAPLPKRRHSTRRGGKRKAAIKLGLPGLARCAQCGAVKLPHVVCQNCGYYGGNVIVTKKEKKVKKK